MLRKYIERTLKRAKRRADSYKDTTEKTHTFHGGYSKGYWEGKISALESILEELDCADELTEHNYEQLSRDKVELIEFVKMVANGKTEDGDSAILHTRIHADAARELQEKHKGN